MSTTVMALCWPLVMPPTPKSVLISLADNANDMGHCWPSISTISARTCLNRRSVMRAIEWLEGHGVLRADRVNGRHTSYLVTPDCYKKPVSESHRCNKVTGDTESRTSVTESPDRCHRVTGPVSQSHTNHKEPSRTVNSNRKASHAEPVFELPEWLDRAAWDGFVEFRKSIPKVPFTPMAQKLAIAALAKLRAEGNDPVALINQSILNGWRGFFPLKTNAIPKLAASPSAANLRRL